MGQSLAGWRDGDRELLVRQFGDRPVWSLVSTFAADSFYAGMTYAQANDLAHSEVDGDVSRDAVVAILIGRLMGRPL